MALPVEVEEEVLAYVSLRSVGRCMLVCKEWHNILKQQRFWVGVFALRFGGHRPLLQKFGGDWSRMTFKCWTEWNKKVKRRPVLGRLGWALSGGHHALVRHLITKHKITLD